MRTKREVSQKLGICSFQSFLSGARYLQNVVDMMKVWVLKFPETSELLCWQVPKPAFMAALSFPHRILTWLLPMCTRCCSAEVLPRVFSVHEQTMSSLCPHSTAEALVAAFLSGR